MTLKDVEISDVLSAIAIVVSIGVLLIQFRQWLESGVRLKVRASGDVLEVTSMIQLQPEEVKDTYILLNVTNSGVAPTRVRSVFCCVFPSVLHRIFEYRGKYWEYPHVLSGGYPRLSQGDMLDFRLRYTPELRALREKGRLFVGLKSAHRNRAYFARVPKKVAGILESVE